MHQQLMQRRIHSPPQAIPGLGPQGAPLAVCLMLQGLPLATICRTAMLVSQRQCSTRLNAARLHRQANFQSDTQYVCTAVAPLIIRAVRSDLTLGLR